MKEKILNALKTKYAGVQNALLDRVADNLTKTVTDETKIQDAVNGLDSLPISITDFGLMLQTEGDKRAQTAVLTHETSLKDKFNFVPKSTPTPSPAPIPIPINETADQKDLRELREWRQSVTNKETQAALRSKLTAKLDEKKIPHSFAEGVLIEKEEDIENAFKSVESKYTEVKQHFINENILIDKPAGGVQANSTDAVKADIENLASKF